MGNTLKIFAFLLGATVLFHTVLNFMLGNISDFETVALPPKKLPEIKSPYSLLKVDATSKEQWTLVDLSTGKTHRVREPEEDTERLKNLSWDLGFQRTKIITNSGVTNPDGNVGVLNLGPVPFSEVGDIPATGYVEDARSFGKLINKSIADWYNYRTRTHNIESKKNVYIVRTTSGRFMKMRILNYYCHKPEADCRTAMCGRDEAACLTIEYAFSSDGKRFPPPPADAMSARAAVPDHEP
jgi:hypothetical protein